MEALADINPDDFTVRATRKLIPIWRAAVRQFVMAVAHEILVDTGMSAASLVPLAYEFRTKQAFDSIIRGKIKRPTSNKYNGGYGFTGTGEPKSYSQGVRLGESAYDYSFPDNPDYPQFYFKFDIVILQFYLKENGLGRGDQFSEAMTAGEEAFIDYWSEHSQYVIASELAYSIEI